jgi:shikimate dehydrogenase
MAKWNRYALFGHPVGHSVSPRMFNAALGALNERDVYLALDLASESDLRDAVDDLRSGALHGANVTLPYKQTVLGLVDVVAASAQQVGAANVLTVSDGLVTAHNTDVDALAAEIEALWNDRVGQSGRSYSRAAVVGGGGAALAAIAACRRLGFKLVCATSRSWSNSEAMYESTSAKQARTLGVLTTLWPGDSEGPVTERSKASQVLRLQWSDLVGEADCVIQATSAGMLGGARGEDVAAVVPWKRLPEHALIYDVVYNPPVTPFLAAARQHGLRAEGGLGMLVRQAELAFKMWTGNDAPRDVMRTAAEAELAGRGTEA